MKPWLMNGEVTHRRIFPKENQFSYRVFYMQFPLSQISQLKLPVFSLNRWNLFSFHQKDHSGHETGSLEQWFQGELRTRGLEVTEVMLQTFPARWEWSLIL